MAVVVASCTSSDIPPEAPAEAQALVAGETGDGSAPATTAFATDGERVRCATRVAIALTGLAPDAELLADPEPTGPAQLARVMSTAEFRDRLASFLAARSGGQPSAATDVAYAVANHVLVNNLPWKNVFNGTFGIDLDLAVTDDAAGLGYFHDLRWRESVAGNEPAGVQIVAANAILTAVLGVQRSTIVSADDAEIGLNTRQTDPGCASCHFEPTFGLDRVAALLPPRESPVGVQPPTFAAAAASTGELLFVGTGPQSPYASGITFTNDREMIDEMVKTAQYRFQACSDFSTFLYGRAVSQAELRSFDGCMAAMEGSGLATEAIAAIIGDEEFCR